MDKRNSQGGYVALMATVIISVVLLVMVAQEGFAGYHARYTVLGTERKEQANALAEGCADQALSSVIADPSYTGAIQNTLPVGMCYVSPVDFATPGSAVIRVQSQVGSASAGGTTFSNLEITSNTGQVNTSRAGSTPILGTILVQTLVQNSKNTSAKPGDFLMAVNSNGSQLSTFTGSATGVVVHVAAGNYSVSEQKLSGFVIAGEPGCSGTIAAGDVKTCSVLNNAVTTTLTLVDSVVNDNRGQKAPTDFGLLVDGNPAAFGVAVDVAPGTHILGIATSTMDGYLSSVDWSCLPQTVGAQNGVSGAVDIATGDNKVCVVKLDDIPPPNPSCADTVMVLDRTGSMSSSERSWLKTAANRLESLYALVTVNSPNLPAPKLGVGSFGGITTVSSTTALVPYGNQNGDGTTVKGFLTTVYNDILAAISTMMGSGSCSSSGSSDTCSNIAAGISTASIELSSANHTLANQKVLILISDAIPSLPGGSSVTNTGTSSPTADAQNGVGDSWTNPTSAYTAADGGVNATALIGSGTTKHRFFNFNLPDIPSDATVNGIEVDADAWSTAGNASSSSFYPSGTGSFSQWLANTGSATAALGSNDATDATYIDINATNLTHTFKFSNAGLPGSASEINAVTLSVVARGVMNGSTLQLMEENSEKSILGPSQTLTTSYATYSYTFPTKSDGTAWTIGEVNAWTTKFGVRTTGGSPVPRVSQMYVTVTYQ